MSQTFRDDSRLFLDFLREIKGSDESYRDEIWVIRDKAYGDIRKPRKGAWPIKRVEAMQSNVEPMRKKVVRT